MNKRIPDWNSLSSISYNNHQFFDKERYDAYINGLWINVIKNNDRDNGEIKSVWYRICEDSPETKRDFLSYIMESRAKGDHRPISWEEIMRFMRYMSIKGKKTARVTVNKYF